MSLSLVVMFLSFLEVCMPGCEISAFLESLCHDVSEPLAGLCSHMSCLSIWGSISWVWGLLAI